MPLNSLFEISMSGLTVEKTRMEVLSLNLANANSTAAPNGQVFKPLKVLSTPLYQSFEANLNTQLPLGAKIEAIVEDQSGSRKVKEPGHPKADKNGYVEYANVNPMQEMLTLLEATRSYEANIKAIQATKSMAMAALEIGRNR